MNHKEYAVVSLFSGCGGLDLGLTQAGFSVELAIEIDPVACETYKINHPKTIVWNKDVTTVSGKEIKKVIGNKKIIVAGGSPCQSWSEFKLEMKNNKTGLEDYRGQLIYEYLRLVEELQPEMIVFENVPYMVSKQHLPAFQEFKEKLHKRTGLSLEYKILNAFHFGQAQLRERVIMIGRKEGIPNPFHFLKCIEGAKTLREALKDCPSSEYFPFKKSDKEVMKSIKEGQCWNVLPPNIAYQVMGKNYRGICLDCGHPFTGRNQCPKCNSYRFKNGKGITSYLRRLSWDKPSYTVCAVPTNKTHGMLAHPTEQRCLSIRECARLQGFPDTFIFKGNIIEKQKQIGNAVPVGMAKAVGLAMMEALTREKETTKMLEYIVHHPNRFILTELEKDFVRLCLKKQQDQKKFPEKYSTYLKEIIRKIK
ncbi:DNA cytosine methyltransferase [Caldifermentibacillus hisashii]|uniref:DNA cytosine methyltransferase n=1 Tax=Caldifermentibacillus hisashii TaxID=996558 RepID=UPI0022B95B42|nr:DNA cytosine methyltransferase [Caldifermentibacillus hisashii]MED4852225.1 DNA cytosine methyltransferase [Caldifermentibacillus hisashii]